jgi:hypothetical protein
MDLPAVGFAMEPSDVFLRHEPVHQAHGAVMEDLKALGQFADLDVVTFREPFDREHRLVLLWSQAGRVRRRLAETKELAQRVSELGQHDVVFFGNFVRCHNGHGVQHSGGDDKFKS